MKIKVLSHVYDVEYVTEPFADDLCILGRCNTNMLRLEIKEGMCASRHREVLLHEIMHAIYYELGCVDGDAEERMITTLSQGLAQVMCDNPWLKDILFPEDEEVVSL